MQKLCLRNSPIQTGERISEKVKVILVLNKEHEYKLSMQRMLHAQREGYPGAVQEASKNYLRERVMVQA